jgi:hypothetical protein
MRLAIRLSEHKSGQTKFDSESFEIWEELEEVSMMKSASNWISYLYKFFQIFLNWYLFFSHRRRFSGFVLKSGKSGEWGRLAVTWSPRVMPQLAVVGGVSYHACVWVKSLILIRRSVSEAVTPRRVQLVVVRSRDAEQLPSLKQPDPAASTV